MVRWLHILALSATLMGAEKIVTLKNGQQYSVKTTFGKPILKSNEYIKLDTITPCYDQMYGWRKIHYYWSISFMFNQNFKGVITVDSPLCPNKSWSIPFNTTPGMGDYMFLHRIEIMESEYTPEVWEWVNESGDSWVPFHFAVKPDALGNPIDSIEWVKINENQKDRARSDFKKIEAFYNSYTTKEITSITKEKYNIKINKSGPLRFDNNFLQIDSLLPGIAQLTNKMKAFAFSISGKYRGQGEILLTISAPAVSKSFLHKVKIKNSGQFEIPFAFSDLEPDCWTWLESELEYWVPLQIQAEKRDTGEVINFIEWFHVTNVVRNELNKLSRLSPSP